MCEVGCAYIKKEPVSDALCLHFVTATKSNALNKACMEKFDIGIEEAISVDSYIVSYKLPVFGVSWLTYYAD